MLLVVSMSSLRKGTLAQFGPSLLPWTHWLYPKESAMATNNSFWTMEILRKQRSTCRNVARAGKILTKYPTHNSVYSENIQSLSRRKRKRESLSLTMILKKIWHPVNGIVKSHCVIEVSLNTQIHKILQLLTQWSEFMQVFQKIFIEVWLIYNIT